MRAWHTMDISFVHIFQYIFEHILGDIYIYISISLSRSIYRWWPRNTLIYIRMHFMRKGAGASNNVCVHSIDDP